MCLNEIGLCVPNMVIILGLIGNMIEKICMNINEHKNLHFDNEYYIRMSFIKEVADLDVLIILYSLCVSYPRKLKWAS